MDEEDREEGIGGLGKNRRIEEIGGERGGGEERGE